MAKSKAFAPVSFVPAKSWTAISSNLFGNLAPGVVTGMRSMLHRR